MRLASLSAAFLVPALFSAAQVEKKADNSPSVSPTLDLLPEGSTLTDVSLPRYDQDKNPAALLRAGLMTVVTRGHITGENVQLNVFESDGTTKLTAHFGSASYLVDEGLLEAKEVVNLTAENYRTRGTAGIFQLNKRRGYIFGPIDTTFTRKLQENASDKKTAMNLSSPTLTGLAVLGLTSIALAEAPKKLNAEELSLIEQQARDTSAEFASKSAPIKRKIIRTDQISQAADLSFRTFANQVQRPDLLTIAVATPVKEPDLPQAPDVIEEPPLAKPNPEETTHITCEGGMYFNTDNGQVVYLQNVVVAKPNFTLTASKELKIFLEAKPEQLDQKNPKAKKADAGMGNFSDVSTIIGTGGIKVVRKDDKGRIMTATADTATWDAKTGDMVLRGGFPMVRSGNSSLRAKEPGLYIRIYANGNMITQPGKWDSTIVKPK